MFQFFASFQLLANVCDRSESMRLVLEDHISKGCKEISKKDLAEITELHFYESILSETSSYFAELNSKDFKGFSNLKFLDLNWIFLRSFPGDLFAEIPYLERLHWGFGNLDEFDFKADNPLRYLTGLKYLTLTNLKMDYLGPEIFSDLKNLEILSINHTDDLLTRIHPQAFSNLKNLRILRMLRPIVVSKKLLSLFSENRKLEALGLHFSAQSKFLPGGLFKNLFKLKLLYIESPGTPRLSRYFFYGLKNLELLFVKEAAFFQQVHTYHFSKMNKLKLNFSIISFRFGASREVEQDALQKRLSGIRVCKDLDSEACQFMDVVPDVNE